MSAVLEADGDVRPCFFHGAVGNVRDTPIGDIVAHHMPAFRRSLSMEDDPICTRCVCSMKTGWRTAPWAS